MKRPKEPLTAGETFMLILFGLAADHLFAVVVRLWL